MAASNSKKKRNRKIIGGVIIAAGVGTALYFLLKKKKSRGSVIVDDVVNVGPVPDDFTLFPSGTPGASVRPDIIDQRYEVRWDTRISGIRLPKNC